MTQKERVTGLFEFLMDLLDEKEVKTVKEVAETETETISQTKVLQNPSLPHHPLLNPFIVSDDVKPSWVDGSLEMMNKIAAIDKERAEERNKVRIADNATRPLINELRQLKEQGHKNALEVKETEELETIVGEVGDKLGVTIVDGQIKLVNVPNELRDNIPLDESQVVDGPTDDLPQHIVDKLETSVSVPEPTLEKISSKKPVTKKSITKKPVITTATNRKKNK